MSLVWMELGRASKTSKKRKRVIRRWRLDRFGDDEVKLSYQSALMAEVHEFSESTKSKIERGKKGQELVNAYKRVSQPSVSKFKEDWL